jgi:hypothetical protein
MSKLIQAMSDLACVKDIIQAFSPEEKKELFKLFITSLSNSATENHVNSNKNDRPTTPVTTSHEFSTSKRPLNSPESSQRRKKDNSVF